MLGDALTTGPAGWSGFRLDAWVGDETGNVARGETGPRLATPMVWSGDSEWFAGDLTLPVTKQRTTYVVAVTGVGPDGRRHVFATDRATTMPWVGSAWEWLAPP